MKKKINRFTALWLGGYAITGAVVGVILAGALGLSRMWLLGLGFSGLVGGFCLAVGIAEAIVLVGGAFELDERGATFPRLRRIVRRFDQLIETLSGW